MTLFPIQSVGSGRGIKCLTHSRVFVRRTWSCGRISFVCSGQNSDIDYSTSVALIRSVSRTRRASRMSGKYCIPEQTTSLDLMTTNVTVLPGPAQPKSHVRYTRRSVSSDHSTYQMMYIATRQVHLSVAAFNTATTGLVNIERTSTATHMFAFYTCTCITVDVQP